MKIFSKILSAITIMALLGTWIAVPLTVRAAARDCDSNAVIYCGAYTTSEMARKINNGTGRPHQSASQLKSLFAKYHISTSDFGRLKNGRVTSNNRVYVGSKLVASNVYSMGRSYMPGSTKVSGVSYPLYLRHPSVSFRSSSIDAFVYLNNDGSMRYAIIKSCGNIVPGKMPAPTYKLNVIKFNDLNMDKLRQSNEPRLAGWDFVVTGPNGYRKTVRTPSTGKYVLTGLKPGTYTVTERQKANWVSTTGLTKRVRITTKDVSAVFGNALVREQEGVRLQVIKFNDQNENREMDENEALLSGWTFHVEGQGISQDVTTDANGQFLINGLVPGRYTVTERMKSGWRNTTGLEISREVSTNEASQVFVFGNRQLSAPKPTPKQKALPTSGPIETAAAALASMTFTGGALAYIRSKKELLTAIKNK